MSIPAVSLSALPEVRRILLATDLSLSAESLAALPYLRGIADTFGSSVFLWHSTAAGDHDFRTAPIEIPHIAKHAAEKLETLANTVQLQNLDVTALVTNGSISSELPKAIEANNIDLVVARTNGRRGLQRILYGSVVDEICRVANCPVLTVGPFLIPRKELRFRRIILPSDLSLHSQRVLPIVVALARRYGASVTVLHVLPDGWEQRADGTSVREAAMRAMGRSFAQPLARVNTELFRKCCYPVMLCWGWDLLAS